MELQAKVCGAPDITQDAFNELKVRVTGGMHEETHLLDRIGQIRTSECEVLKCTGEAPVETGVMAWRTISGGEFGLSVYGGGDGVAIEHLGTV
jgi:hypothetical protein